MKPARLGWSAASMALSDSNSIIPMSPRPSRRARSRIDLRLSERTHASSKSSSLMRPLPHSKTSLALRMIMPWPSPNLRLRFATSGSSRASARRASTSLASAAAESWKAGRVSSRSTFRGRFAPMYRLRLPRPSDATEDSDGDAEDHRGAEVPRADVDGRHVLRCGLKPNVVGRPEVVADDGLVADHDGRDLAVLGGELLREEEVVAFDDAGVGHRAALYAEAEDVEGVLEHEALDAHGVDVKLVAEDGPSRDDAADDRDLQDGAVGRKERVRLRWIGHGGRPERARLHVLADEHPFALQGANVVVHAVGRLDAHVPSDLAQRWRVPALGDRSADEVEHHALSVGDLLHGGDLATYWSSRTRQRVNLRTDRCRATLPLPRKGLT